MRSLVRRLSAAWQAPRAVELVFAALVVLVVFVYIPARLTFGSRLSGASWTPVQLNWPEPPLSQTKDIDPEGLLQIPAEPGGPPRPAYDAEGRNLFAYATPKPAPTPVRAVPTPNLAATPPPPPATPSPPPTPPPWRTKLKLIGVFGYPNDLVAALKDESANAVYVARAGQVIELRKDGLLVGREKVAKVTASGVEVGNPEGAGSETLKLSE